MIEQGSQVATTQNYPGLTSMDPFRWTEQTELAASLLVAGDLSLDDVASRVGVTRKTIYSWRHHPEFKSRVEEELASFRDEVRRLGIGTVERRVEALNDRWQRLRRVVEARAQDPDMASVPGGSTGLVVVDQIRGVGEGDNFKLISTFAVDTSLLKELREIEKQAAQELGQWQVKAESRAVDIREAVALTQAAALAYVDPDD